MAEAYKKIATAKDLPRLERYINEFAYSTNYRIDPVTLEIKNPLRAAPPGWFVERLRNGYVFGIRPTSAGDPRRSRGRRARRGRDPQRHASREWLWEMSDMLKRAGYERPEENANKLFDEGMGPEELRGRLHGKYNLEYTHGLKKKARDVRRSRGARRDYVLSDGRSAVSRPFEMLGPAVKQAKALSTARSFGGLGGEVAVIERRGHHTREIGRAKRGTFFESSGRRDLKRRRRRSRSSR